MKDEKIEALKRFNDTQSKIIAEYVQTSIIDELKKIREDLKEMACEGYDFGINEDFLYLYDVLCYLDDRIAELNMKGDDNN